MGSTQNYEVLLEDFMKILNRQHTTIIRQSIDAIREQCK